MAQGAKAAGSPKEVAQNSEVIITMMPSEAITEQVILGSRRRYPRHVSRLGGGGHEHH